MFRVATLLALLVVLGTNGCHVHEYVVAGDEVPLYATPSLDRVIEHMPLGHHEKIEETDDRTGAVKVLYNGREGWARKTDLRLLSYVHPELDEGADKEETVGRAVRDVTVRAAGKDWDEGTKDAIRAGRVLDGMTREQVELAWGWPRTIEPLANPSGGERWIYRRRGYETLDGSVRAAHRFRPARFSQPWGGDSGAGYYRLPVVEERIVEFATGKVSRSYVRRYYDIEGSTDDD